MQGKCPSTMLFLLPPPKLLYLPSTTCPFLPAPTTTIPLPKLHDPPVQYPSYPLGTWAPCLKSWWQAQRSLSLWLYSQPASGPTTPNSHLICTHSPYPTWCHRATRPSWSWEQRSRAGIPPMLVGRQQRKGRKQPLNNGLLATDSISLASSDCGNI